MSADEVHSRPLALSMPKAATVDGTYQVRRPNLQEILANTAPSPWTLAAFMAYLSNNHCLEILEFTMDAGRYKKHYLRMMNKASPPGNPSAHDIDYVKDLWKRLIEAYILPNGSREVNLPSGVRDPIVAVTPGALPPAPELLDAAVSKTFELMEESVLVPFLNSIYPQSAVSRSSIYSHTDPSENSSHPMTDDQSRSNRRSRHSSRSSPPESVDVSPSSGNSLPGGRKAAPSALTNALNRGRFSSKSSPTSSAPSAPMTVPINVTSSGSDYIASAPGLSDDSGSSGSLGHDSPMTPPITPPMSDISGSPRTGRDSGTWKKLGRLSGWKPGRKKSQSDLE